MTDSTPSRRYVRPGWFTKHVFNPLVAILTRVGISVWGSRELRVRGRKSGEWRTTPVNLLIYEANRYLVAPRGETQWVRNLRVAGVGEVVVCSPPRSDGTVIGVRYSRRRDPSRTRLSRG